MRRVLFALLATLAGCSLQSEGTAENVDLGDTGTVNADTGVPGDDTSTPPEDSTVEDSTVPDTSPGDTTVPDTFVPDTFVPDTFVPDTFVPDTFVPDTFVPDTFVPDTFVPDTFVPDTFVPDTYVPDTFVPDTYVPDTFVPETPTTGFLSCTATAPSSVDVNLTTDGTIDWAHWGYLTASAWNHKSGGTALTKGTNSGATFWGTYPTKFTWSNGTPTASVSNTSTGIYVQNKNDTFVFDSAGDSLAERTLTVYTTWNGGSGTIDAALSDSSATAASSTIPPTGVTVGSGIKPMVYTCRYRPLTAGAKLTITVTQTTSGGYVSLLAASLK